jgi:uncharacterized protein YegL
MKTMICLILDRSGSMQGRENDVIGGVNSFIEEQKKLPDPASVAFVRFDTDATERFRPMKPLAEVEPLTRSDYQPRGGTPLLDAVGRTVTALDEDWKTEKPERCIVVIVTDGEENSSKEYTKAKIQALIKARQDSGMWAFIYLGANVDAFHEAGSLGIAAANTAGYTNTAAGVKHMYDTAASSVKQMRASGATLSHNLGRNLGEKDEEDTQQAVPAPIPTLQQAASTAWVPPTSASTSSGAWTPPS